MTTALYTVDGGVGGGGDVICVTSIVFVAEKEDVSPMVNGNDREAKCMTVKK